MNTLAVLLPFWFFLRQNPVFALDGRSLQPKKRFKLNSKQVCGQCRGEFRVQRPNDKTRGKHFDQLGIFSNVLDASETLHDLVERNLRGKNFSWTWNSHVVFMRRSWKLHKVLKFLWQSHKFMKFCWTFHELLMKSSWKVLPHHADPAHPFTPRTVE